MHANALTRYLHVKVLDPSGHEIVVRSVELGLTRLPSPSQATKTPRVSVSGDEVVVAIGDRIQYTFDSSSGVLTGLEIAGEQWIDGSDFLLWRPVTYSERNVLDRRKVQHNWNTFLQGLPAQALSWQVDERQGSVVLSSKVEYTANERYFDCAHFDTNTGFQNGV